MKTLIKNAVIINEGSIFDSDLLINKERIEKIAPDISADSTTKVIDIDGSYLIPGIIDDQVHFREPGLTHKAEIATEAAAAVAGGITSYMEMPNTYPPAVTIEELENKYKIASNNSIANYSFYMGTTNFNQEEVLKIDKELVCGTKIFLGSSTGDMLVNNRNALEKIFSESETIIAIHSEDDEIIRRNLLEYKKQYGQDIPNEAHPEIRSVEACYSMTKYATSLAKKYGTKLHVLHLTTEEELEFFEIGDLEHKNITSEVCVHHLYFDKDDYSKYGSMIKCNPAIKDKRHKSALRKALMEDRIDVVASDHAPHTLKEKRRVYFKSPSGIPLVEHTFYMMYELYKQRVITLKKTIEKMCHAPARLFRIKERGFIREGYYADLAVFNPRSVLMVNKDNLHYKCGWSPFEGHTFTGKFTHTFVNGHLAYENGVFDYSVPGKRLNFER